MDHVGWKTSSSAHHYIKLNPVLHPCGVSDTLAGISSDFMERSWVLPKPSLLRTAFFVVLNRGYYMAAQGYEFYLLVLKVSLTSERSERVRDTFSTRR